jgi:hypothetical protein
MISTQVEFNQRIETSEVLDVFNDVTSEVENSQIREML